MDKSIKKVFISTIPFGEVSTEPIEILRKNNVEFEINPLGRKIKKDELIDHIKEVDCLIAGTEDITAEVLDKAPRLKLISRVGIGVDNIPFEETNRRGIRVTRTPDAPTLAVAELIVGLIIDSLRNFGAVNTDLHRGKWQKYMGEQLKGKTVGIIGVGRIGKTLIKLLQPFGVNILGNDIAEDRSFSQKYNFLFVDKDEIYAKSDILSLNLSYSPLVKHLINKNTLGQMKPTAVLINTARGPLVNEDDLYIALKLNRLRGAAIDVFEQEPYDGKFRELQNIILTAHIGAATRESRRLMELGAVEEVIRFIKGEKLLNQVTSNN